MYDGHLDMLHDTERNEAYRDAINLAVAQIRRRSSDTNFEAIDIGTGSGLLACLVAAPLPGHPAFRPSALAELISADSRRNVCTPVSAKGKRHAKMLGVATSGGTRRVTADFKENKHRLLTLRKLGFNTRVAVWPPY